MSETKVVNVQSEDCNVYIGRGKGGDADMLNTEPTEKGWLGNPFSLRHYTREESIRKFRDEFVKKIFTNDEFKKEVDKLEGKKLGCWCKPKNCHGDVIKQYLDEDDEFFWESLREIVYDEYDDSEMDIMGLNIIGIEILISKIERLEERIEKLEGKYLEGE